MQADDPSGMRNAVRTCSIIAWRGTVWRAHSSKYGATDHGGSLRGPGRYHRVLGGDGEDGWPALYTSLEHAGAMAEIAHSHALDGQPLLPKGMRYSSISVNLSRVLDCRRPMGAGSSTADLTGAWDIPQALAFAARAISVEAMLVPSAVIDAGADLDADAPIRTNLVIFPDLLLPESSLLVSGSFSLRRPL